MYYLDYKESEIIRLYYGVNNVSNMTLMEIGKDSISLRVNQLDL